MYSKMLYMKTRVTFRVASDLVESLRQLSNQTEFVEAALRAALGRTCPTCEGSGRVAQRGLSVTRFRDAGLPPLDRAGAIELRRLVRVARGLAATDLSLTCGTDRPLEFVLRRETQVLLEGRLSSGAAGARAS
jgi:hypothetical protein